MSALSDTSDRASMPPTGPFRALGYRNYRLYFIGQFVSMCGTWLQLVAEGWLVWSLTHNAFQVGLVSACGSVPTLLLSLPGGTLADRVDRRRLLLVTQSLAMLLAAALGVLSMMPWLKVWHVAALAALLGCVSAFDVPTRQAFVVQTVDRDALMNAIALNSMLFNSARIIGPALASAAVAIPAIGVPGCFFLNSASYVGALTAIYLIRLPEGSVPAPREETPFQSIAAGLRYVRDTPVVLRLIGLLAGAGIFGWSVSVLMAPMADQVLKGGAKAYGALMIANGVGAVTGSLILARLGDVPYKRAIVYGGVALWTASLLLFSLSRFLPLSVVALALAGAGTILFSATSNTVVQGMVPEELRGRVMGAWTLVFAGSTPIGSLLAGTLAQLWGPPRALEINAVALAVCGLVVYRASQQSRARAALREARG
ncbi:MAG TPA: MFS transporter [Armatimonadota bacterium]|nr:MFS transporter [Armatimonadota bacterium]